MERITSTFSGIVTWVGLQCSRVLY
jgi:hypothetical protein